MKNILVLITLSISLLSHGIFADDQKAADTLFHSLGINKKSVALESYNEVAEGYFSITLSFKIQPANSCQANYAGLLLVKNNSYKVVYASPVNARCKMFARPRTVEHKLNIAVKESEKMTLKLNGKSFQINNDNGDLTLK